MKLPATAFIITNADGEPLGIDQDSGGYPYPPDTLNGIRYWDVEQHAQDYANIFKNSGYSTIKLPWIVRKVTLTCE